MTLTTWLNAEPFRVIGWTIIHSLWQCLGLLALLKVFLLLTPLRRSGLRYAAASVVLATAVLSGLLTFVWEYCVLGGAGVAAGLGQLATAGAIKVGADTLKVPLAGPMGWLGVLGRLFPWLAVGWLFGIAFFAGRLLYSGYELRKLRLLPDLVDSEVSALLARLRVKMGLGQPVRLIVSDQVSGPLTFGLLKAVVVLPLHYVSQVPTDQLEMILAHELAHIRRRDYLVNLCQSVFDVLFFYNPFYRVLSGIVRNEREYCCDDLAASAGDERILALALTNLKLVTQHRSLLLSAAPSRSGFYRRVSRLIEREQQAVVSMRGALAGLLGAAVVVLLLTQCSRSVIKQDAVGAPESMEQVLTDNQAGYKEQVFFFRQGGSAHELFLVSTQDKQEPLYGYVDGVRVEQAGLDQFVVAMKRGRERVTIGVRVASRGDSMATLIVQADSIEKMLKVKVAADGNLSSLKERLDEIDSRQVVLSMEQYKKDVKGIPIGVKQHEVLTRIIVSGAYSPADRAAVRELIRQRQTL